MNIVIDGRMLYWTGVGRYTAALLDELQEIDQDNNYSVLVRREDWDKWRPAKPNFRKVEANIDPYSPDEQAKLPGIIRKLQADVVHFTAPNAPLAATAPRVVTVHDLTLVNHNTSRHGGVKGWLWHGKRLAFRAVLAGNIRAASVVLADTEYVARQLRARYRMAAKKVAVAPLAASPLTAKPESLKRFGPLGEFILYAGNSYPYKNIGSTIEALGELKERQPYLSLVIAGKPDTYTKALVARARHLGMENRVKFVGYVSDGELVSLYRGAAVYVNPSLSEGFGLQGLEAMAEGTPVVAARASCLPEVYGEAAEYFDPRDPADQARALESVLGDKKAAERLAAAGRERVKAFSWRRTAELTLEAYKKAAR